MGFSKMFHQSQINLYEKMGAKDDSVANNYSYNTTQNIKRGKNTKRGSVVDMTNASTTLMEVNMTDMLGGREPSAGHVRANSNLSLISESMKNIGRSSPSQ